LLEFRESDNEIYEISSNQHRFMRPDVITSYGGGGKMCENTCIASLHIS